MFNTVVHHNVDWISADYEGDWRTHEGFPLCFCRTYYDNNNHTFYLYMGQFFMMTGFLFSLWVENHLRRLHRSFFFFFISGCTWTRSPSACICLVVFSAINKLRQLMKTETRGNHTVFFFLWKKNQTFLFVVDAKRMYLNKCVVNVNELSSLYTVFFWVSFCLKHYCCRALIVLFYF